MLSYSIGDLVVLLETVEWDDLIGVQGEICIISRIYDRSGLDDGVFFDYQIHTADGIALDVWEGEITLLRDEQKI